jgi:outer membrane protein insertion porin family
MFNPLINRISLLTRILIIFIVAWTTHAAAQGLLNSVEFKGNRAFSARTLGEFSDLKVGQTFRPEMAEAAADKVLQRLAEEGYFFARVDSLKLTWAGDSSRVSLLIHLTEGGRLILSNLTIAGDSTRREDYFPLSRSGRPLSPEDLEQDMWDLLRFHEELGHPFARLDIDALRLSGDSLAAQARVTPGPSAAIASVRIEGLKHTQPRILARETRLVPGEPYNPRRIERAQLRLRRLPYIEEVSEPALAPLGSDRYDLWFTAKEARANSFDVVMGYQPGSAGQKSQVTGLLDLTFQNLFGTGRKARVHWERLSESRMAMELFYEEPWLLGLPLSLWGNFRQEILDTLYLNRYFSAGSNYAVTDLLMLGGSVFQEEVLPDSMGKVLGYYQSKSLGGALEVSYDVRDSEDNPTRGWYYRSSASAADKEYEADAPQTSFGVRRYEADIDWSKRLWGRQILNLQMHGRLLQTGERPIPQPDLYRLGGSRTLRGYREDQFLGSTIGWAAIEYRLWVDKSSRVYAFFNVGYWERETQAADSSFVTQSSWPWGYGLGFRQGTRLGIIGFDFALGEGDRLSTAKVHFRLINRF